jgi:hypothetical protein
MGAKIAMSDADKTPLQKLEAICEEIQERWDKDMRSGKLLLALAGHIPRYRQDVTDVRDALASSQEWQPIETAPKDGTPILLGWQGKHFDASKGHFENGCWGWLTEKMAFRAYDTQPTHWMSLPSSPSPKAEG